MDVVWQVVVAVAAGVAALAVFQSFARTKHHADEMLDHYRQVLADAREVRARELTRVVDEPEDDAALL